MAQKQNNQWRFGINGAIDFNNTPPTALPGCVIQTGEGSASIADRTTGALLFYTDGITVWNANNQPMPNGTGLLGGTPTLLSSTTAAVIIPKPLAQSLYYIVTIDEQSSGNGVRYTLVDMALNNGLGDVVAAEKNRFLYNTTSEKLHVAPTADGCGYWLLTNDTPGNQFAAFKITRDGWQLTPVLSTIGGVQGNGAGHMKVNRQFNKLAMGNFFDNTIELFDFNNATGVVSNPTIWNFSTPNGQVFYGFEFSPDGTKLYVSNLGTIVQFDITLATPALIQASAFNVAQNAGSFYQPATLQLGPDNKIYVAAGIIDVINAPNNAGVLCGFQQNVIDFQATGGGSGYGLPQWVYYNELLVLNNDIVFEDSCYNSPALFSLQDSTGLSGVRWDFGDPNTGLNNTSTIFSPSHTFSDSGAYSVRAIVQINCREDTLFKTIVITNCDTSDCKISIPNAFTPNNDGANDTFQPISKCPLEEYVCTIYNRWGELIFQTINPKEPWDGKKFGLECTSDVYVYVITCKTATVPLKTYTDEVTLVR